MANKASRSDPTVDAKSLMLGFKRTCIPHTSPARKKRDEGHGSIPQQVVFYLKNEIPFVTISPLSPHAHGVKELGALREVLASEPRSCRWMRWRGSSRSVRGSGWDVEVRDEEGRIQVFVFLLPSF